MDKRRQLSFRGMGSREGQGMDNPPKFEVHIHDSVHHQPRGVTVLPALPYPGLVVVHRSGSWEVERVQLLARDKHSLAEKHDDPHMVMVIARSVEGSFFD